MFSSVSTPAFGWFIFFLVHPYSVSPCPPFTPCCLVPTTNAPAFYSCACLIYVGSDNGKLYIWQLKETCCWIYHFMGKDPFDLCSSVQISYGQNELQNYNKRAPQGYSDHSVFCRTSSFRWYEKWINALFSLSLCNACPDVMCKVGWVLKANPYLFTFCYADSEWDRPAQDQDLRVPWLRWWRRDEDTEEAQGKCKLNSVFLVVSK